MPTPRGEELPLHRAIQLVRHGGELELNELVVEAIRVDGAVQFREQAFPILRQKINSSDFTFLKSFVREKRVAKVIGVAVDQLALT